MCRNIRSPYPNVPDTIISTPVPHVLLVQLNRPKQLNALRREMHYHLAHLWNWFDDEPSLRCAVITGTGRAFCAGADLKEWHDTHEDASGAVQNVEKWTDDGFAALSNRRGKKPIIAAVNGLCLGGGMEMILNADLVLASEAAQFGLPEVKRGVVAIAGALPRLTKLVGRIRASELALTGRMFSAAKMEDWGIVNEVVRSPKDLVEEALRWASEIASNSPDSIVVSREGLITGWDAENPQKATLLVGDNLYRKMDGGENMKEGVLSFVEKRQPVWKDSKL